MRIHWVVAACAAFAAGCAAPPAGLGRGESARQEVIATEKAFAKTMADRDFAAFGAFVAEDTVFFSGPAPLRGKRAVLDFWKRFYVKPAAPFSWTPEEVEVLAGGELALSSGPVHDPAGKLIARFSSIWRQEAPGRWRIVFDKGSPACDCEKR